MGPQKEHSMKNRGNKQGDIQLHISQTHYMISDN